MDQATRKVRAMYEQFPYPSRSPNELGDFFPHLCMSYREDYRFRPKLTILDAGCGTGGFSLGTALCNPDCRVVAVDINRQALARLRVALISSPVGASCITSLSRCKGCANCSRS